MSEITKTIKTASSITLENLYGGAISEAFDHELSNVLLNVADLNNDAKSPRKISISLEIKPNEQRDYAVLKITVKSSCNPHTRPIDTGMLINRRADLVTAAERSIEQQSLFDRAMEEYSPQG